MIAALPLAWKIGLPIGMALLVIGGYIGWEHYQQSVGRAEAEAEYRDQLMAQQQEAIGHYIVSEKLKLRTVERAGAAKDQLNAKLRQSYQEVVAYESRESMEVPTLERPACAVSPDLVRTVNGLARVLDDVSTQRPASAGGAAGEPAGSPRGPAAGSAGAGDGGGSSETHPRADGPADEPHH
jgi:hypothetical protein